MTIGNKARKDVMARDNGECQFFCGGRKATQVAHKDHQGAGGLPVSHWKNQPPNLAAACDSCHKLHQNVYIWEEFEPMSDKGPGKMVLRTLGGELVPQENLWFYQRWLKKAAELASKSLQTIGVVDHLVGQMMHDLRVGAHFLPEGGEFDQYVSSLGWDPLQAAKIADAFDWAGDHGGWPDGVPFAKVELLMGTDFSGLDEMDEDAREANTPRAYLRLAQDGSSYSSLQRALQEAKLRQSIVRNYLVGTVSSLMGAGQLVRTSDELGLLAEAGQRGMAVLKINAFKGALEFKRGEHAGLIDKGNPGNKIHPVSLQVFKGEG